MLLPLFLTREKGKPAWKMEELKLRGQKEAAGQHGMSVPRGLATS